MSPKTASKTISKFLFTNYFFNDILCLEIYTKEVDFMLLSESLKVQNIPILINKDEISNLLDLAITNDPSLGVGKITPTVEDDTNNLDIINSEDDTVETNCLALTVKQDYSLSIAKNAFFKGIRMSFKVAVSTFFLNVAKIFL